MLREPSRQNNLDSQAVHRHKGPQQNKPNCTVYFGAVPKLLRRDLSCHRRVVCAAFVAPLLLLAIGIQIGGVRDGVAMGGFIGLLLMGLLPLTLHLRESMLGTLPDLLALPVARRELVRLRFLEGLLVCAAFLLLGGLLALVCTRPHPADVKAALSRTLLNVLLWVLVITLAYPLPFVLRWGARGLAAAFGALVGIYFLLVLALLALVRLGVMPSGYLLLLPILLTALPVPFALRWGRRGLVAACAALATALLLFWSLVHGSAALRAGLLNLLGKLSDRSYPLVDTGLPLLLLAAFYAISVRAIERLDA